MTRLYRKIVYVSLVIYLLLQLKCAQKLELQKMQKPT